MMLKLATITLCILHLTAYTATFPRPFQSTLRARDNRRPLQAIEDAYEYESMDSNVRAARAATSSDGDYYKSDEREGNGEIGYSRKKTGGGKKGYQHFDTYHKKAGDNYEFEKQDSYGLDDKGQDGAYSHRHETTAKRDRDHERAKLRELEDFDEPEEDSSRRRSKEHSKERGTHSELREGADDGNGGVESFGHDPKDYILPEKYTYGKDNDAYDF